MSQSMPTERDYFVTWIQFAICNAIGGAVAGAVAGAVVGALIGSPHANPRLFLIATAGAGFVASLPVSYFFFRVFVSRLWFRFQPALSNTPSCPGESN
jgi:F0F1-type ATP synthase membrane subunit c/vacuolar-type H+-ATPase subunit K